MAIAETKSSSSSSSSSDGKLWGFLKKPFRQSEKTTPNFSSSSSSQNQYHGHGHGHGMSHHSSSQLEGGSNAHASNPSVSSVARSLLPTRRRLKLDPSNKLYFPCLSLPSSSFFSSSSNCVFFFVWTYLFYFLLFA